MKCLTQWEQLVQNASIGPHLPLLVVPPVTTIAWTDESWARWMGLDVDTYRQVCRIGERHR